MSLDLDFFILGLMRHSFPSRNIQFHTIVYFEKIASSKSIFYAHKHLYQYMNVYKFKNIKDY